MASLYELTDELKAAQRDLGEMLGNEVITAEEYDDTLAAMLEQHQVKTVGVIAHIKNLNAEAVLYKGEIERLTKRLKSAHKSAEFYNGYLLSQMVKLGQVEAGEGIHTAKIKAGAERCEIIGDIAEKWLITKTTTTPDKRAITEAIKAGETIKGAAMVQAPDSVRI
ncbi:siphovirus Gp157 family protein [bacterium]|nr:siphovirus Gp157 family protein [bacterium]